MSAFAVTVEQIESVAPHSNADRLEVARLCGLAYTMVVGKGAFRPGENVIYFPLDALLPPDIADAVTSGRTEGKAHRVRTIKLRGQVSQGIIAKPRTVGVAPSTLTLHQDVTAFLGVTKYEPPVTSSRNGNLHPLPPFVGKYDLENAERYPHLAAQLMDVPVYISEKIEGSHWGVTLHPKTGEFFVLQRNFHIVPRDEGDVHVWRKVAWEGAYNAKLHNLALHLDTPDAITIRGEIIGPGVQGNYYGLKQHEVRVFEIEVDGAPVAAHELQRLGAMFGLPLVPRLWFGGTLREWLDGATLADKSNGRSLLADKPREGVVIKPCVERNVSEIGRLVLKQRSPKYLLKGN